MFSPDVATMLYVDDVAAEKDFWVAAGCVLVSEEQMMGFDTFTMKPCAESSCLFTVYAKAFIEQVSPDAIFSVPSVLFSASDVDATHARIASLTETVSEVIEGPVRSFNFASPSGIYFAVQQG